MVRATAPSIVSSVIATKTRVPEQVFPDRRRFNLTSSSDFPMSFPEFRERKKKRRTTSTPSRAREAAFVLATKISARVSNYLNI
jgi:hypothetical protein